MSIKQKFKDFFESLWKGIKACHFWLDKYAPIQCIVIGVLTNFIVEAMHRHSVFAAFEHVFLSPLPFLFNSLIVTTVLSLCTLSKRRYFFYILAVCVFLGFGIGNGVLLTMRVTPLEWADLQVVKFSIIRIYLSVIEIILFALLIIAAIAALVIFFIKFPKRKSVNRISAGISSVLFSVLLVISLTVLRSNGILLSEHVKNLANAYKDYGFNYCFMCSMFDLGVDKPSQYDKYDVEKIVSAANSASPNQNSPLKADDEQAPNIIFLQLETFFDVSHLSGVKYSENPIPNFTKLHDNFTKGYISVPSIGAGTANTEFEVISGLSLEYFGVGEYPYKTILQQTACESICYNLKGRGYKSHAIHNNNAVFYDRNIVFSNLGFDTFTSMEYMNDIELTETGWVKDAVLIPSIKNALDSTTGKDLVYTITVQSHGKYPSDYEGELPITVEGFKDLQDKKAFEYYVNELHNVDAFIGNLIAELEARDERTMVIMFGDHLPSFDISQEELTNNDLFQTEYVIWDNFGLKKQDRDLYAYQLGASVLEKLGFNDGLFTKLHQSLSTHSKYRDWLEILEYDTLYGECYAFGGKENYPYKNTELKMGVLDIEISEVQPTEDNLGISIKGDNFTANSVVYINDVKQKTLVVDKETLIVADKTLLAGDRIKVSQVDKENSVLSSTKTYLIGGTEESPTIEVDTNIIYKERGLKTSTAIAIILISLAVLSVCTTITVRILHKKKLENNKL